MEWFSNDQYQRNYFGQIGTDVNNTVNQSELEVST